MPHVGDILVGRYRIDTPLGAGGSAMVYRAHDLRLGRDVALKILLPNLASDSAVAHRFEREARSLAAVNHPGIVAVYDVEAADKRTGREPFFVMELCERGSLADLLAAQGGRLSPNAVGPTIADIAGGLTSLHARGFVHRDVKPHNILLTPGGAKLGDFGIARTGDATSSFTAPGTAIGTLAYLAPELLAGGDATPASDVFALGVVVYQALTGRLPRPAASVVEFVQAQGSPIPPPSEVQPELGTFFDAPVGAALATDPAARPAPMQLGGSIKAAVADWQRSGRRIDPPATAPGSTASDPGESVRDGRRPVRLAPPDQGVPAAARTATVRIRTGPRPPPPDWLPRRRRSWTGPIVAGILLVALGGVVAVALTNGFGLFGRTALRPTPSVLASPSPSADGSANPSASASPSPSPTASPSPSRSPLPSPASSPSPSPLVTPAPTALPTASPVATPVPIVTPPRAVDVTAARAAIQNIGTAIDNLSATGGVTAGAAEDLRLRLEGIASAVGDRQFEDAALRARDLQARIETLIADGVLANSGELRQEVDKLRGALPRA